MYKKKIRLITKCIKILFISFHNLNKDITFITNILQLLAKFDEFEKQCKMLALFADHVLIQGSKEKEMEKEMEMEMDNQVIWRRNRSYFDQKFGEKWLEMPESFWIFDTMQNVNVNKNNPILFQHGWPTTSVMNAKKIGLFIEDTIFAFDTVFYNGTLVLLRRELGIYCKGLRIAVQNKNTHPNQKNIHTPFEIRSFPFSF